MGIIFHLMKTGENIANVVLAVSHIQVMMVTDLARKSSGCEDKVRPFQGSNEFTGVDGCSTITTINNNKVGEL